MPGADDSASSITTASLRQHRADGLKQRERLHRRPAGHGPRFAHDASRASLRQASRPRDFEPGRWRRRGPRVIARTDRSNIGQRALGVAKDRDLGRIVLADLPRIGVEMDERQSGRPSG